MVSQNFRAKFIIEIQTQCGTQEEIKIISRQTQFPKQYPVVSEVQRDSKRKSDQKQHCNGTPAPKAKRLKITSDRAVQCELLMYEPAELIKMNAKNEGRD